MFSWGLWHRLSDLWLSSWLVLIQRDVLFFLTLFLYLILELIWLLWWDVRAKSITIIFRCRRALPCITINAKFFPSCLTLLIATEITGFPKVAWFSHPGATWMLTNKITFPFLETRQQAEASTSTRITTAVSEMLDGSWRHLGNSVATSPAILRQSSCTVNLIQASTGMITVRSRDEYVD